MTVLRAVIIGLLVLPGVALAASPSIAVVGIHQSELDASQTAAVAGLVKAINATGKFTALDDKKVAQHIAGREPIILQDAFLGPGRRLLDNGRVLYEQASFPEALAVLQQAVDALKPGMAEANSSKDLWDAYTYLGVTYVAQDDALNAGKAFANAIALNPARTLSTAKFAPDVVSKFEAIRAAQLKLPSVLTVIADTPDVAIFLNGDPKGNSPAVLQNVAPGPNYIVARGKGGSQAYTEVDLTASGAQTVQMHMGSPSLGTGATDKLARQRQATALYKALGENADVDLVLLCGTFQDHLYLQLYSPKTDAFSTPVSVTFAATADDEAMAAIPSLLATLGSDGLIPADQTTPSAVPLDVGANGLLAQLLLSPRPLPAGTTPSKVVIKHQGRWVGYALGGALGVGAVTAGTFGIIALTGGGSDPNQGTIIVGPIP